LRSERVVWLVIEQVHFIEFNWLLFFKFLLLRLPGIPRRKRPEILLEFLLRLVLLPEQCVLIFALLDLN
jgi:hypothetical protein